MNLTNRPIYQKGLKPAKVKAVRDHSRSQPCRLMIPGLCRMDEQYSVDCHLRLFGLAGAAQKPDDLFIVDACDRCHWVLDHRDLWADAHLGWKDVLRGLMFSQQSRRASGLILLRGEA